MQQGTVSDWVALYIKLTVSPVYLPLRELLLTSCISIASCPNSGWHVINSAFPEFAPNGALHAISETSKLCAASDSIKHRVSINSLGTDHDSRLRKSV